MVQFTFKRLCYRIETNYFVCGWRESNLGLAGCGIGLKIEAGSGIREILRPGYGMKISWRDRDALISIDGMRDDSEIVGGMRDLNSK